MGNTHTQACKAQLIVSWVLGAEVGGILDAPWRSHREIVQRERRACSDNNRGEIPPPFFRAIMPSYLCEMWDILGDYLFLPLFSLAS